MATATTSAPEEQPRISAIGRIIGALFNPRATFEDIARAPSWLAPIILMTVVSLGLSVTINQRVNWEQVFRQRLERMPTVAQRMEQMPPEERQRALERDALGSKIFRYVRGAIGTLALAAFLAAVYSATFNGLAGAGVGFTASLGILSYALLPVTIRDLLGIPILYLKDPSTIDPENFVASNLGAVLGSDAPLWQVALASSMDLFTLWSVFLVAVGFSVANPKKVSFRKALGIAFAVYVVFTMIGVGIAVVAS